MRNSRLKNYWFPALLLALLAIGLATRLYGAWCLRHNLNPDAGVVALMVKHMAEGRDFPVFFYGQPYMGSFEPLVSAALCRLFGCSGFMVCLGTALLGLLTLPFIYRWARDLGSSRAAGIAALAWCLVGPAGYFHYQISPRGGYAATLFFGTALLWLCGRLIVRERQGDRPAAPWYFLLGLLMGLGWWSNQLVAASLATAALVFALFMLPRLLFRRAPLIAAGFALGSLPFWWWNATHQWASFNFAGTFGELSAWDGLGLFFFDRLPDLLDLADAPLEQAVAGAVIFTAAALITAGVLFAAGRERQLGPSVFGLMLCLFILVSALIFSTSHFAAMNTSRYLLPLVPAIAVIVGVMTGRLQTWLPKNLAWAAWLPLVVLITFQLPALQWAGIRARAEKAHQRIIEGAVPFLRARGVEATYIPYAKYAWNFALREELLLSLLPVDRYPPYSRRAELADRIAIIDDECSVGEFLSGCGGSARFEIPEQIAVHSEFAPPDITPLALPPASAARIVDSTGHDAFFATTDHNLDTWWESISNTNEDEWVEIRFRKPQRICMVRLLCFPEYPPELQVEGIEPGGAWRQLTPIIHASSYYWSGPRLYFSDWLYRLNITFPPVTVEALRLRRIGIKFGIRELQWFAPAAEPAVPEAKAFPELVRLVQERGIDRLYCDRWIANAIYRTCRESVRVPLDPVIFNETVRRLGADMRLTPQTGILARQEDADTCRRVLRKRLLEPRSTPVGPWVLFDFDPAQKTDDSTDALGLQWSTFGRGHTKVTFAVPPGDELGLQWSGFSCFLVRHKSWSATLARCAEAQYRHGNRDRAEELVRRAMVAYSNNYPALERLAAWVEEDGQSAVAAFWRQRSALLARPETAAEIRFDNDVTFRGLTLSSRRIRPGETLTIRYYWQYPLQPLADRPWVFVHFQDERGSFQDDHPLCRPAGADEQPFPEVFMDEREITVPDDLTPGRYAVMLGLYLPEARGRRIRADTRLPGQHRAFAIPVSLEVTDP